MNYFKLFQLFIFMLFANCCAAQVRVEGAWIQLAPPSAKVNAAYMQIHNPHMQLQTIVGLRADCCATAMLHQTRKDGDRVVMDHLEHLAIPAQTSVQLAPGGLHIMLMHADKELALDSMTTIHFDFADGSTQGVELYVKKTKP